MKFFLQNLTFKNSKHHYPTGCSFVFVHLKASTPTSFQRTPKCPQFLLVSIWKLKFWWFFYLTMEKTGVLHLHNPSRCSLHQCYWLVENLFEGVCSIGTQISGRHTSIANYWALFVLELSYKNQLCCFLSPNFCFTQVITDLSLEAFGPSKVKFRQQLDSTIRSWSADIQICT